jgi:branched-chain amino acid transport system permease protein
MSAPILQILVGALILTSIYSVIGLGLNLVYSTTRLLNIAHGDFVMIGGYITYWLFTLFGLDPLISLACTAALVGLMAFVMYRFLFRYLIRTSPSSEVVESRSLLIFFRPVHCC